MADETERCTQELNTGTHNIITAQKQQINSGFKGKILLLRPNPLTINMTVQKILLLSAAISLSAATFAQKSNVRKANRELQNAVKAASGNDAGSEMLSLERAKSAIDTAAVNAGTKDDPETWLTKATVYISLQANSSLNAKKPYLVSYDALKKAFSLDPKFENKQEALEVIMRTAFYAFNDGVSSFNASNYSDALTSIAKTLDLLGTKEDKRFADHKDVDTIRAQALMISGYSAYYSDKYDQAIGFLNDCKDSKYLTADAANIYLLLAQSYEKTNKKTEQLAAIEAGIKSYPKDENLKNAELNYYITSGDTKTLIQKFTENTQNDPNNAQAFFNLGILYDQLANPKDGTTPSNKTELSQKAETALNKAIEISPDDPQMNYQLAAHYYNQAVAINNVMSQMTGNDQAKYDKLQLQRDGLFGKALPLLEKSKSIYQPKASSLTGDDHRFYVQTLQALAQIYTIQNKLDKAQENRNLLNNM